ncbi:MAG: Fis family transcriptional regulator [Mesorhizobium sp.]|uniref:Fis family transcriptional regulator n=1 Tax=Mesorhizobium sp. TaxID=1871066 RepID=UPI000FE62602|nr:Fis family transcriptional regulator [Mesorhizobium sp.]RWA88229.1 MAG: Fis family transcriptional regulator [Mesorhizobium sp.]RWB54339.1 MAG: Fis family transcriptional regulator [Mesorhizobium sp.]TIU35202.1 MAG: Fis family transcriptional regulator [Mesorhizobium sp.]
MFQPDWLAAFPLPKIMQAAHVVFDAWKDLSAFDRTNFNKRSKEPQLTKVITDRAKSLGRSRGINGSWLPEVVWNVVDPLTAEIKEERRTDILYVWNNEQMTVELVFEFKRLKKGAASRKAYLGESGLERFITGQYSAGQPVALMCGVLLDNHAEVVPAIRSALEGLVSHLAMVPQKSGTYQLCPSTLFPPTAEFDTEHKRPAELAPSHGTIRVAHVFLEFGY